MGPSLPSWPDSDSHGIKPLGRLFRTIPEPVIWFAPKILLLPTPLFCSTAEHYVLAEVDGRFGRDLIEFLVKKDVVTYRSIAEKVIFVYPFTTPVSDLDAQRKRMEQLRQEIGWRLVGCELIECYQ